MKLIRALKNPILVAKYVKSRWHKVLEIAFTFADSQAINKSEKRVLFIDGGSNVGQGFTWFQSYYSNPEIQFQLFEPNPNCLEYLERIQSKSNRKIEIYPAGIGTETAKVKFFGLQTFEGGKLSQGGSIVREHNSDRYVASNDTAIEVQIIDFGAHLVEQAKNYDKIVVKMDIEGAEIDLLQHLIDTGVHKMIDIIYVEFHAQYQVEPLSTVTRRKEIELVKRLQESGIKVRIWH